MLARKVVYVLLLPIYQETEQFKKDTMWPQFQLIQNDIKPSFRIDTTQQSLRGVWNDVTLINGENKFAPTPRRLLRAQNYIKLGEIWRRIV